MQPYGLDNPKLRYIQKLLKTEKSGECDKECSKEWFVDTDPEED